MNSVSDLELNCSVRRIMVRHWIDLGKISVRSTRGVIWLTGDLVKLKNTGEQLTPDKVESLLTEVRQVRGVKRMHARLTNWDADKMEGAVGETNQAPQRRPSSGPGSVITLTAKDIQEALDHAAKEEERKRKEELAMDSTASNS